MILANKEKFLKNTVLQTFSKKKNYNFVDATCGNGYDTCFLAQNFPLSNITAIDIQQEAINNTKILCKEFKNITYIKENHLTFFTNADSKFDFIIFNTGFLPGSKSNICTHAKNTIDTISEALVYLNKHGLLAITIYQGHDDGQEHKALVEYFKSLNKYNYIVFTYQTINTINSPNLYLIEKK